MTNQDGIIMQFIHVWSYGPDREFIIQEQGVTIGVKAAIEEYHQQQRDSFKYEFTHVIDFMAKESFMMDMKSLIEDMEEEETNLEEVRYV